MKYELVFPDPENRCFHPKSKVKANPLPSTLFINLVEVGFYCESCNELVYPQFEDECTNEALPI